MPGHRIGSLPRRPIKRVSRICCALSTPADRSSTRQVRCRPPRRVARRAGGALSLSRRHRLGARCHCRTRPSHHPSQRPPHAPQYVPNVERFGRHLTREFPAIWTFLFDPSIDATNWRAEQALGPVTVRRKVYGGNRSWHGADRQHNSRERDSHHVATPAECARAATSWPNALQTP
jgi:hypothetical protein